MSRRITYGLLLYSLGTALLGLMSMDNADGLRIVAVYASTAGVALYAIPLIYVMRRRRWLQLRHFVLAGIVTGLLVALALAIWYEDRSPLFFLTGFCLVGGLHGCGIWLVAIWKNDDLLDDDDRRDRSEYANVDIVRRPESTPLLLLGLGLGVLYGLVVRSYFELLTPFGVGLVSISFFFFVPFIVGYIRVYYEARVFGDIPVSRAIVVAWQPIFLFLFVTFFTFLEGVICIAMALPAFLFFASLGGLMGRLNHRLRNRRPVVASFVMLPLLLAPIESMLPPSSAVYEVRNAILIEASPLQVWNQLGTVAAIAEDEVPLGLARMIGIPRPLRADMSGADVGAVRTSTWEKGVVFEEVITAWQPGRLMAYEFRIDPDLIPDTALDKHVKLGGEFFSPLRGRYELTSAGNDTTLLTLSTVVEDNTKFGIYSRIWGELIFRDFHSSLLTIVRNRSEGRKAVDR